MLQPLSDSWVKVRQMAVDEEWQGKGVGRSLMDAAELHALEMRPERMVLPSSSIPARAAARDMAVCAARGA